MNKNRKNNNKCKDCKNPIDDRAIRCHSCSNGLKMLGKHHSIETKKLMSKNKKGKYCGKNNPNFDNHKLAGKNHPFFGKRGKEASNYKNGKPKCPVCSKELNYRSIRCQRHATLHQFITTGHPTWKRINYRGIWMRSTWEVKYAKWLDKRNIKWYYELKTFDLGKTTYTPDFYLPESDTYIEIKGWWRGDSKKKFRLFKVKFPKIKIEVLTRDKLKTIGIKILK